MMVRVIYLVLISLLVFISGCADDNSNGSSNQNVSTDGTIGSTGSVANVKEYFTAGPQTTVSAAVNAKESSREQNQYQNQNQNQNQHQYHNDFESKESDGVRLYFRYADNTTAEAVYNIGGQNYNAIVDDMVYAGHNWIGLELEQLYSVDGTSNQANRRTDRIGLLNVKTGEIIVVENAAFQKCQDLETLEVLGNNKAYFLCENSAYSLDLQSKEVIQIGTNQHEKFDDSYAVIFPDGKGVYQPESEHGRISAIKLIDNDSTVTGIENLPVKTFKNGKDEIFFFENNILYNLSLNETSLIQEEVMLNENSSVIASTALGPVRNEDDATAKFINKQVILDSDAFYVYDVETNTVTKTAWNNTDYEEMKPFIEISEDTEEHIFFGENGIAYVSGRSTIKYIPYIENAEPKIVNLPADISANSRYEIDDITLIGDTLYFQLEDERTERETYYKADVTQDEIQAEEYTGSKTVMKVIDIDITVTTDDNTGSEDNAGNSGTDTGDNTGSAGNEGAGTETGNGSTTETTPDAETGTETGSTSDNSGADSTAGSSEAGTETQLN
ncbi:MAG: hypothetical protein MSA07_05930 [Mucispirillum sp.]|nr:hypothetical protein [Mucispirillum sp.]